jgi:glucuronate isomerase
MSHMPAPPSSRLSVHPDRLLPSNPTERAIARRLYGSVRNLPIVSPHGHIEPHLLVENAAFADPASLLVTSDHYVTRLLHAAGVDPDLLYTAVTPTSEVVARQQWRLFCAHWPVLRGTVAQYWLECVLTEIFGVETVPSAETADALYDLVAARLTTDEFRPRALFDSFDIEVLATTDDPASDLAAHDALAAHPGWTGRVVPAFRPDRFMEPDRPGWNDAVEELGRVAGTDTGSYHGFVSALEARRQAFLERGATTADHAHLDARAEPLDISEAERLYSSAKRGEISVEGAAAFRRHMIFEMARMSCDDGLVMTLHPGVLRDHHGPTAARCGPDSGADIPVRCEFTEALRPLLERFGTHRGFHLVVFTTDETAWSRELAPLAGFYPSVYLGAPWWFLDSPEALRRFREAITDIAGYARTSGFVDDTRAFCSLPARHDMSRRVEAGILARRVAEHRLGEDEAADVLTDLVTRQPLAVFKLGKGGA